MKPPRKEQEREFPRSRTFVKLCRRIDQFVRAQGDPAPVFITIPERSLGWLFRKNPKYDREVMIAGLEKRYLDKDITISFRTQDDATMVAIYCTDTNSQPAIIH